MTVIGDHDPMGPFAANNLGYWVECECHWIGPTCYTEASALASHTRHQDAQP